METIEELRARQEEIRGRLQELDHDHAGDELPEDARSEWNELNEEFDRNEARIAELTARRERIEQLGDESEQREEATGGLQTPRPSSTRGEDIYDLSTVRASVSSPDEAAREMSERALRAIERSDFPHEDAERESVQGQLERMVRTREGSEQGELARHLLATGSPVYHRAFARALRGQPVRPEEMRALELGTDSEGGYAVPFQLDPTIIPTSNGSVNPYRQISRVESIVGTNEWRGVSSGGITAGRSDEEAESSDDSPALAQPVATVSKVDAFVPFSIELGQDWGAIQAELAVLFQDAKDDEEAAAFTTGDGTGVNPEGIAVGASTTVETATANTFAVGDLYLVEEAVPARFRPRAQWVAARATYNDARQFDTAGGAALWVRLAEGLRNEPGGNTGHELLGYRANEASAMASGVASGALTMVLGDFRYFLIVDRIGMTVDLIPHLFGGNNRPTGQRGLYAYWRNTSKVLAANAFRVLEIKAP